MSAHKFHGPKGVGALYIRKGVRMNNLIYGGAQERNLRAGTENLASIVGLGQGHRAGRGRTAGLCGAHDCACAIELIDGILKQHP